MFPHTMFTVEFFPDVYFPDGLEDVTDDGEIHCVATRDYLTHDVDVRDYLVRDVECSDSSCECG